MELEIIEYELIKEVKPYGTSKNYYPEMPYGLIDCRDAYRLLIVLWSTCNQDLTVQTIGAVSNQARSESVFNIGATRTLSATSRITLSPDLGIYWHPYIGCAVISGATPPTSGYVLARGYVQRFRR